MGTQDEDKQNKNNPEYMGYTRRRQGKQKQSRETGNIGYTMKTSFTPETGNMGYTSCQRQTLSCVTKVSLESRELATLDCFCSVCLRLVHMTKFQTKQKQSRETGNMSTQDEDKQNKSNPEKLAT